jgi:hypothetical protein
MGHGKMRDLLMFVDLPKFTGCRFLDLIQFLGKSSFLRLPRLPLPLFSRLTLAICLISIIFSIFIPIAWSAQVTLEWAASSGNVAGYNVYQGTSSRDYDVTLDVGNWTSVTIADLEDGEAYYFSVTAYDLEYSESGYSNEVCINCASQGATNSSGGDGGGGG